MKGFIEVTCYSGELGIDYYEFKKSICVRYIIDIDSFLDETLIFYHDYTSVYKINVKESYEEIKELIKQAKS